MLNKKNVVDITTQLNNRRISNNANIIFAFFENNEKFVEVFNEFDELKNNEFMSYLLEIVSEWSNVITVSTKNNFYNSLLYFNLVSSLKMFVEFQTRVTFKDIDILNEDSFNTYINMVTENLKEPALVNHFNGLKDIIELYKKIV